MTNTGEKLQPESDAEISPANAANTGDAAYIKIEKIGNIAAAAVSAVQIEEQKEKRDFTNIFSRLKKSARKRSVSIL